MAAVVLGSTGTLQAAPPAMPLERPAGYVLAWHDEFDRDGLPAEDKWAFDTARNRAGWYNDEAQYYAKERLANSRVENGRLVIEAHREDLSRQRLRDWGGQLFSSARLTTRGKSRWRGGYFEVRARMPCVEGAWPAIWLLPDTHRADWGAGEIDIAEFVGFEPSRVHHAVHTRERNIHRGNQLQASSEVDACHAFHTYQLLWTDAQVVIGTDGAVGLTVPASSFKQPMSIILNLAVGGTWGGAEGIDEGAFPARLEVEYVRVWQAPSVPHG